MGDMAEDALQQGLDAWVDGDADWDYAGESGYGPRPRTCRRCHAQNLWWSLSGGKWRLIDSAGNRHVCPNPKAKDVFK
jgi:hypothetical protein